jgi:4-carboxymuconolactone decarboxylase
LKAKQDVLHGTGLRQTPILESRKKSRQGNIPSGKTPQVIFSPNGGFTDLFQSDFSGRIEKWNAGPEIARPSFALLKSARMQQFPANSPAFDRAKIRENSMKTILRASIICVLFAGSAAALSGERMATIPLDKMTSAQRSVADAIMTGPRKSIGGPFNAWLRSPELADRLQKVGEYVRFNTSLDKRINEMAIIMTAQAWGSQYEWHAHAPLAIKAGLDPAIVAAIGAGGKPDNMKDDEAIVWEFTTQLRRDHGVDDAIYGRAMEKFGEAGIMDLVAVNGYYDVVSMTLNVARVAAPAGEESPFKQAGR